MTTAAQKIPAGYKQTLVGVIPSDWLTPALADIVDFTNGKPYESYVVDSGKYKVITLDSIDIGGKLKKHHRTTNHYDGSLKKGDIVMVLSDIAHAKLLGLCDIVPADNEYVLNQRMARIRTIKEDDPSFLRLQINAHQNHFRTRGQGTSQRHIYKRDVYELVIPIPPTRHEQASIATTLSDADILIERLEALIEKKKNIKQGAMRELLTGKRRLPGFSGDWVHKTLGEIAHIKTGGRNNQDKRSDGEYPFFVRSATIERIGSFSYDCEAILVPGEGNIGNIFHYINGRFDVHQRVYAITQFAKDISGRFIYFHMRTYFGAHAMQNSVKATVDSLRLPTFQEFLMLIPPTKSEQEAIAGALQDMDAEIDRLTSQLEKYRDIKQGMMQVLLTGKIRLVTN